MPKTPLRDQVVVVTGASDTLPGAPAPRRAGRFDDRARGRTIWTRLRLLLPKG
jgi:hypothetical protein